MRALLLLALLILPALARAQQAATLVADSLTVQGETLTASGNVEAYYDGTRLSAAAVSYNRTTDRLSITGPIFIDSGDGQVLTATSATLDGRLRAGLLIGARLVLERQLQLAAAEIERFDGRYLRLSRVAATSCHVCDGRPPLWEIRAEEVIYDADTRQIWFERAQLRVSGAPVLWLPRIRLPDPAQTRVTGLLVPSAQPSDTLGFRVRLPYFFRLGDSRDLTLTPSFSPLTRTLEARYREAFFNGDIAFNGAVSDDDLAEGIRYYLAAAARFDLARGYRLTLDAITVSDRAYLATYGYSDDDRLVSTLRLERVGDHRLSFIELAHVETLRDGEVQADLPPDLLRWHVEASRALSPQTALAWSADIDGFARPGAGRDMLRLGAGAGLHWRRVFGPGLVANAEAGLAADAFLITDDPDAGTFLRVSPAVTATLRWPLVRHGAEATHLLEPVVQIGWADTYGRSPPNEDSLHLEFDEGNFLALSHFPGEDAAESGLRLALGLAWTMTDAESRAIRLSFGRIWRPEPVTGFSTASGLSGETSDWLLAGQVQLPSGFAATGRTLFSDDGTFGKTGAELGWQNAAVALSAAYVWLPTDLSEGRPDAVSEWSFDAGYQISQHWRVSLDGRYDVANRQPARAGFGLGWQNECVAVDFSVTRRYTSATEAEPSTDFGLQLSLKGFSTGGAADVAPAACGG